ncbi:hypothetical protein FV226_05190 [Methylobacterium sp. WL12]|uniref:hypothetical protein n=1 Tax=Methylobacterium sp. WL12 TaxID=2603890 RepID=UPI0011C8047D|nr:hypothetical protein [Methylobacterium sp. WL12]TXM74774.1 hypothetical protein FV226_05190 [Methylobacterium sp. WL12]
MLRSGFLLGVSAPAAILTLLVHPMVQAGADQWVPATPIVAPASFEARPLPGMRPVSLAIRPSRVASLQAGPNRAMPAAMETAQEIGTKPPLKPRMRMRMREGCEAALSSLVGPEARRMIPGRCIS